MNDNIVIVTGGFDPIHSGHIEYIKAARTYGRVMVGLNSDDWLQRKKGSAFMNFEERCSIIENLKDVMGVVSFDDSDNTACDAILKVKALFPKNKIIFANGGDRKPDNIPEMERLKDDPTIEFVFGVGGTDKKNSSSTILHNWKSERTERSWGFYEVFYKNEDATIKVKRLVLNPGHSISMQKHFKRHEFWHVESGIGSVWTLGEEYLADGKPIIEKVASIDKHMQVIIEANDWHQLRNESEEPLSIIEIQYGNYCDESDIERV